jgi:hypothetical protein
MTGNHSCADAPSRRPRLALPDSGFLETAVRADNGFSDTGRATDCTTPTQLEVSMGGRLQDPTDSSLAEPSDPRRAAPAADRNLEAWPPGDGSQP